MSVRARPRFTYQCMRCWKKVHRTEPLPEGSKKRHACQGDLVLVGYLPEDGLTTATKQCKDGDEPGRV